MAASDKHHFGAELFGFLNQITQTGIACANKIVAEQTASGGTRLFLEEQSDQELFVYGSFVCFDSLRQHG